MKATDLYKLIVEREKDEIGKVSYANDHTPNNHVGGKKSREVDPLPDPGTKRDERNPAKIGDVKKKEKRSMEGPKTGAKRVTEQGEPAPYPSAQGIEVGKEQAPTRLTPVQQQVKKQVQIDYHTGNITLTMRDGKKRHLKVQPDTAQKVYNAITSAPDDTVRATFDKLLKHSQPAGAVASQSPLQQGARTSGRTVGQPMSQQQIAQAGSGWALESTMSESGVENAGSMSKKTPVKQGDACCKSATVRSAKQNDEPKPTADVGKPKSKEKRSMDANPAPVKDTKGGENEHKKMGVHEGIKELESLLKRKISTPFLTEQGSDQEYSDQMRYMSSTGAHLDGNDLDTAFKYYLRTILWAETDESTPSGGEPLDKNYDISDFAPESVAQAKKEVAAFLKAAQPYLPEDADMELVGYCFWLNRVGHGTGFWDREEVYGEEGAEALSELSGKAGNRNAYLGDDGKIYIEQG